MATKNVTLFAKLSLDYADHPKIQALSDAAFRAHVEMILYSRRYLTDGRIPNRVANRFGSDALSELMSNDEARPSLWRDEANDYWLYGYADMQDTREEVAARRLVNSQNGKKGGRPAKPIETQSVTEPLTQPGTQNKAETETETETSKDSCSSDAKASSKRDTIDNDFDAWWKHYPRKVGKGQAIKAYRTARKTTDAATLTTAIQQQAPTLTANGAEFTPHPATWLNGQRWADDDSVTNISTVQKLAERHPDADVRLWQQRLKGKRANQRAGIDVDGIAELEQMIRARGGVA